MAGEILLTILLVLLNGFFVAAEFAIVKVRSSQIEVRKGTNKTVLKVAKSVIGNLDGYLAATQLGITLASLGLGWVGEDVFTNVILKLLASLHINISETLAHRIAIPVAFLLITILHIVFGELAPKSLAIRKSASTTFAVAVPLKIFYIVFRPFIWLLNGFANIVLKTIGIRPAGEGDEVHSEEELKVIIAESHKGGIIEETEKSLIQNVFSLGDRPIASLMTPRNEVVWLDVAEDNDKNREKIIHNKHTVYPLCDGELDNVIGFVYSKDLIGEDFTLSVANLRSIARKVQVVTVNGKAYSVLERFKRERIFQAVIVDEFGSVKGFVTINDIVDALVGDISETDEFEYSVEKENEDGSLIVDAQIPFVEFLEKIGAEYSPEAVTNYITLGGYILDTLEKIPAVNDTVTWNDLILEVIEMDRNRIAKVRVTWQ